MDDWRLRIARATVLAFALSNGAAAWAAALSFDEARAALAQASDAQKAAEAAVSGRSHDARAADSLGHPDLSVSATQIWGIKTATLDTPLGVIDINQNLQGPRSSFDTTWPIYTGGRIEAKQRSLAAGVREAQSELEQLEQRLDDTLANVYFGVCLAISVERTRRSVLEQADRQLERAKRFEQRGVIPLVERLNTQVARDEAAREHVSAQRDLEIARMRLQRLLVRDAPVEPTTPLFVITRPGKPLAEWLALAESQNPTLRAYAARRTQAEQGIAAAEAGWKPEVFAFGTYSTIKHYQTLIEPNWRAGIGVSFQLYSREDRANQVGSARDTLRRVESLDGEARNEILTAVEAAYRKVEQAREQFQLLESSIAGARENLRLRERGFEEGQATSLDINEARNALARVETSRSVAAYEFVVALSKLLEVSGEKRSLSQFVQRADVTLQP
jgi:outer membrane protein TolC